MRAQVILPQYARPGRRTTVFWFCLGLAACCFAYGFGFGLMAPARIVQFGFPLLGLAALTVWALPELGTAPTRTMEKFFYVFFLSIPLWPNYLAIALPGLPWITMLRLVGFPLVFMLVVSVSISRSFRKEMGEALGGAPMLWRFVTAFAILQVLSVGLSNAPQISIQRLLVAQVNWIAMFFIAAYVLRKPGRAELWAALLVAAAVVVTAIAIREFQLQKVLWAGHIPSFLAVEDESVQRVLNIGFRAGTLRYRSQATYSTALGLGEFLAVATPFILHFIAGPYRLWVRLLALPLLPFIFLGIYLTDTRLSVVGFIMSIGIYIFFWGALRWQQDRKGLLGPAIVLSYPATAVAFIAAVLIVPRLRMMTLGGGQHQASTEARYAQWAEGIPLVLSHPWGFGIARGAPALGYTNPGGVMTIDTYWLLTALDYGLVGFFLFYGAYLIAMWKGFWTIARGVKAREVLLLIPLTISLFVYVVIKSIYAGVENQSITFIMLGAVAALVYRANAEKTADGVPITSRIRRRRM
ncbi:MAG: hypothetical protein ABS78_09695 [Phenylobacterium sp. SCN 70-31]|nr:MAG: hypothetical protein ABS78_09695 [Phenylobacterium sp. SCN 70-31]